MTSYLLSAIIIIFRSPEICEGISKKKKGLLRPQRAYLNKRNKKAVAYEKRKRDPLSHL